MTCLKYNQTIATACRNSQPGIKTLWLANYDDITAYELDANDIVTGITMSGSTMWYKVSLNKQVASIMDTGTVNVANGVSICKPSITFKVNGFGTSVRKMYEQLLQATVCAIVQTIDGSKYILGLSNGLDAIEISYGSEAAADGFKGLTIKLEGLEPKPFYEFNVSGFVAPTMYSETSS